MGGESVGAGRLGRLEALKSLLAQREYVTVSELAADLGVSARTVHRDLEVLRELGVPIEGDRGRGGGIRLEPGWSLGRVHLNESEALGLLLSLAIAEQIGSPLLLEDLRSVTRKVAAAFAPGQSRRILALRRRVLIGSSASGAVLAGYSPPPPAVTRAILEAFSQLRLAEIFYRDRHGSDTTRVIELQFLYYSLPVWYVVAWDRLREEVRSFRIDRIQGARTIDERFGLRPAEQFITAGELAVRTM